MPELMRARGSAHRGAMPGADPKHWLHRLTADEWLRAGMRELSLARDSIGSRLQRTALAGLRRAAGMGWNAVLALDVDAEPDPSFGRTYVDHLRSLAAEANPRDGSTIPAEVRIAARVLMDDPAAQKTEVVQILTRTRDQKLLDAAETVLAEAYARLARANHAAG